MRTLASTPVLFLLFVFLGFSPAKAQTAQELAAQTQWMNAWTCWMNTTRQNNTQAQLIEAEAKLITAQAAVITAAASANKTNAEALQALEQARTLALANELKKAETFYGKKALYGNHKDLYGAPSRPTKEDMLRYSRASAPQRLTEEQFDLIVRRGEIRWPSVLQKDEFEEHRSQIETLFVKRLDSELDSDQDIQGQVQDVTDRMYAGLRSLVREVPLSEYAEARKFIRSLAYESQFDFEVGNQIGKVAAAR